jgi:hypothetical protein
MESDEKNNEEIEETTEVDETFKIEKNGSEEIIETHGELKEPIIPDEKLIKKENRQLRNILWGAGIILVLIVAIIYFLNSVRSFEYEGVEFEVVREGELILYNTKLPLQDDSGNKYEYNFFLRNDPRESQIGFNGSVLIKELVVFYSEEEFGCDGDGIISIANLRQLYEVLGAKVIKDENATCDSEGKYTYINLKEGNETVIEQTGISCYDIVINNCEILAAAEKLMVETFIQVNEDLNY